MISILLPAYHSCELLREVFLPSFDPNSSALKKELIIYDNGDIDPHWPGFLDVLRNLRDGSVTVIGDGTNVGLNAALNACANAASGDYFYLPHTDMVLLPGWDRALREASRFFAPSKFLFCSRSIEPTRGHTPFHVIKDFGKDPDELRISELIDYHNEYNDKSIVTGYRMPFFMHRALWEKMGGVDEKYFSYATDDDLFMTAYDVGVRAFWMVNQSLIYHLQGKSNAKQSVDKNSNEPYEYFNQKWRKKGYNTSQSIDSLVQSLIPWNLKIR